MNDSILDRSHVALLYAGTVLLLLAGNELGYRIGRWRRAHMPEGEKASSTAIQGSTLGLLAFMLAFTFGSAVSRFDTRKQLVLDEASAILRAHQRAQLLPEPQKAECSKLLQEYVRLRLEIATLRSVTEMEPRLRRSEAIQDSLWQAAAAVTDRPGPGLNPFLQSLSELTDLQLKRVRAGVWNRLPTAIVATLYTIAFLALTAMGYGAGLTDSRTAIPSVMLILTFSAIIVLIVDLDRPRQQLFQVVQEPIADAARRMGVQP
jgi:hypothetical protein